MLADIIIIAVVALIFGLCVKKLISEHKNGCSGCSGNCAGCHQCTGSAPKPKK